MDREVEIVEEENHVEEFLDEEEQIEEVRRGEGIEECEDTDSLLQQNQNEDGGLDEKMRESIQSLLKAELADLKYRMSSIEEKQRIVAEEKEEFLDDEENIEVEENVEEFLEFDVEEDVYSLMMFSPFCSLVYLTGLLVFLFQIVLVGMLYLSLLKGFWTLGSHSLAYYQSETKTTFEIPFGVAPFVRVGQYLVAVLSIFFQSDIHDAIHYILLLRKGNQTNWKILAENQASPPQEANDLSFIRSVFIPNLLRLSQGCATIWIVTLIIKRNNDFLDLLMNFAAIYIVSEIDNIIFKLIRKGFCCSFHIVKTAARIENVKFRHRRRSGSERCGWKTVFNTLNLRSFVVVVATVWLLLEVAKLQWKQDRGIILREVYDECYVHLPYRVGNGECDGYEYNTEACGWDDGDCIVDGYPYCHVDVPWRIGDGICNGEYNTEACGWDGGDCVSGISSAYRTMSPIQFLEILVLLSLSVFSLL